MTYRYPVSQPCIDRDKAKALLNECIDDNWVTSGKKVRQLEARLADFLGVQPERVVATTSGTTALHLALAALGIGLGDDVIVPDLTYVSSVNAVAYVNAQPILVDINPMNFCMHMGGLWQAITSRTKAVMPVHLYGQACDMEAVHALARRHNLLVVEDAAEGLGGSYHGQSLGTIGDVGCFSFYGNKLLTTGEGGACVAKTSALADRIRSLRTMCHNPARRFHHTGLGFNYRMTDVQAAVGLAQMDTLAYQVQARIGIFEQYRSRLEAWVNIPRSLPDTVTAPWLFTCVMPYSIDRAKVMQNLAVLHGIETRPTFVPMHEIYPDPLGHTGYSVATDVGAHGISLPTYTGLTRADVDTICSNFIYEMREAAREG